MLDKNEKIIAKEHEHQQEEKMMKKMKLSSISISSSSLSTVPSSPLTEKIDKQQLKINNEKSLIIKNQMKIPIVLKINSVNSIDDNIIDDDIDDDEPSRYKQQSNHNHQQRINTSPMKEKNLIFTNFINNFFKQIMSSPINKNQSINEEENDDYITINDDNDDDNSKSLHERLTLIFFKLPLKNHQPKQQQKSLRRLNKRMMLKQENRSTQTMMTKQQMIKEPNQSTNQQLQHQSKINYLRFELQRIRRQQRRLLSRLSNLIQDFNNL